LLGNIGNHPGQFPVLPGLRQFVEQSDRDE